MIMVGLGACAETDAAAHRPTMSQAVMEMRAGKWKRAAGLLEQITTDEPRSAGAWRALGNADLHLRRFAPAVIALENALRFEPDSPQTLFRMGEAYAGMHAAEKALAWLERARETRRVDMTGLAEDPILGKLRTDPRLAKLLPGPADFEPPFVEPVKVIREWRGEAAGDQFGWIARHVGDVDGDGISDIVTSAPTHGAHGSNSGRIYVYSVGSGKLLWSADGDPGDQLGTGLEGAGDTNGDGVEDVVASGPGGAGVVRIYSGRDGRVLQTFHPRRKDELFGNHVSGVADLDGHGYADVIVGAPGKSGAQGNPGHVYVYSGRDGTLLRTLNGERDGDGFGSAVSGSLDPQQHLLVVGAPAAGVTRHGRIYVYRGPSSQPAFTFDADDTGSALGEMFVSVVGDADGDGVSDVYGSDWMNEAHGPSTGRIYVYSGRTGETLFTLTGESAGDGFGTSASNAGDVDGDGRADLIVGAWQYGKVAVGAGKGYLYSGRDGRLLATFDCRIPGDAFGFDAVGIGDVDQDGTVDLLITSGWSGVNGHHSGRVFVISSGISSQAQKGRSD